VWSCQIFGITFKTRLPLSIGKLWKAEVRWTLKCCVMSVSGEFLLCLKQGRMKWLLWIMLTNVCQQFKILEMSFKVEILWWLVGRKYLNHILSTRGMSTLIFVLLNYQVDWGDSNICKCTTTLPDEQCRYEIKW